MNNGHDPSEVIGKLIEWAQQRDSIRAMLLTSTRAVPNAPMDDLSDYDVVLIVEDIHPFHEERSWPADFGDVLVVYWDPIYPDPEHRIEKFANVTQYSDGLKIDFTFWPVELLRKIVQASALQAELDAGYRILLDKDHLTDKIQPPTYKAYIPVCPTNELYQTTINDFFSDPPYVAKCLLRGELLPAKWCLDYDMKHVYLRSMLEWLMGIKHNWSLSAGALGKGLKRKLPPEIWSQLEDTYVGADTADNWEALFRTMSLFRQVAIEVGKGLGYTYPTELDQRVTEFVRQMQPDA
ncbi:MAG TPA: aminoglycoside 6-adenylyltransferase [Anaerolineales bacterium]|nr:aminoglycoside 6-adenylyltransferase [Anaerolineales bacterium]HLO31785.1 aminoglycoside 6-adenylyltransferase [Anaerolineales bacterium]